MTMTPTQREAAMRLAYTLDHCGPAEEAAAALLRELAQEPQSEPVGWHVCSVNSDGSLSLEFAAAWEELAHEHINDAINEYDIDGAASWVVRPVYASPQPQQTEPSQNTHPPQQRKPLTEEQVYEAISDQVFWATSKNFILRLVRDIERAHGIGEAP